MAQDGGAGAQAARRSRAAAPARGASTRPGKGAVEAPAGGGPICSVAFCPICAAVTAFGEVRPELIEHLLVAGREMLLALRALIDARLEGASEPAAKMERLSIE